MILLFLLTLLHSDPVDPSVAYSQLQLHTKPGHVDMWTMSEKGCTCQGHAAYTCPCCAPGGCPCSQLGAQRCVQCGMEAACSNGELCVFSCDSNVATSVVHQRRDARVRDMPHTCVHAVPQGDVPVLNWGHRDVSISQPINHQAY